MGDTIQFPKPEDRLRHSAEKAYQAKDYLKAYHDYQEIYTEHSSLRSISLSLSAYSNWLILQKRWKWQMISG